MMTQIIPFIIFFNVLFKNKKVFFFYSALIMFSIFKRLHLSPYFNLLANYSIIRDNILFQNVF